MNDTSLIAVVLAALELAPAEPSDISALLEDDAARSALTTLQDADSDARSDLLSYLISNLDLGRVDQLRKSLEALERESGAWPLLVNDAAYPPLLRSCWDKPPVLFVRGVVEPLPARRTLAIVGSRLAEPDVLEAAYHVAAKAASEGTTVASGLAVGVDTSAHEGALSVGGRTVAVLGTGIRRVFPEQNRDLCDAIAATGAVLSQFAPDAPRTPTTFLRRNSVIAGLADVSLVMDGRARSGSRHQAEQALRYGRRILLWKPTLGSEPWAQALAREEGVLFADSSDAVLRSLGR